MDRMPRNDLQRYLAQRGSGASLHDLPHEQELIVQIAPYFKFSRNTTRKLLRLTLLFFSKDSEGLADSKFNGAGVQRWKP